MQNREKIDLCLFESFDQLAKHIFNKSSSGFLIHIISDTISISIPVKERNRIYLGLDGHCRFLTNEIVGFSAVEVAFVIPNYKISERYDIKTKEELENIIDYYHLLRI